VATTTRTTHTTTSTQDFVKKLSDAAGEKGSGTISSNLRTQVFVSD
jgi:hypothetical protein